MAAPGGISQQVEIAALRDEKDSRIDAWLAAERRKDLLRLTTAGSVDDGKSTLIGRLLYDSRSVYDDHVQSVTRNDAIDFARLTDGLRAEREQGITIDVAYRYFSTAKRRFIVADTPGHEQYTRNMATGASTADVAVVLVDARKGILDQTRRHTCIAALLGIRIAIVAINKMDLVGFSEEVFARHRRDLFALAERLDIPELIAIPICALDGDNIVHRSDRMPWYNSPEYANAACIGDVSMGPTLLQVLESASPAVRSASCGLRFPVQYVIRPHQDFRGFAGQIAAGTARPGDEVVALPSGIRSRIRSIGTHDGELNIASAPRSVTLTLEDEADISRGDMIASTASPPAKSCHLQATLVWMHATPLRPGSTYILKHTTRSVRARVTEIRSRLDIEHLESSPADRIGLNEIGEIVLRTNRPLLADLYSENRSTGSFILIDAADHATAGAGMIRSILDREEAAAHSRGALISLGNRPAVASKFEESLLENGYLAVRTRIQEQASLLPLVRAGAVVLVEGFELGPVTLTLFDSFTDEARDTFPGEDAATLLKMLQEPGDIP
jgi:sulfate adenylyltransferase subunit 1